MFPEAERKQDVEVAMVGSTRGRCRVVVCRVCGRKKPPRRCRARPRELAIKDDIGAMVQAYEAAKTSVASVYRARADVALS